MRCYKWHEKWVLEWDRHSDQWDRSVLPIKKDTCLGKKTTREDGSAIHCWPPFTVAVIHSTQQTANPSHACAHPLDRNIGVEPTEAVACSRTHTSLLCTSALVLDTRPPHPTTTIRSTGTYRSIESPTLFRPPSGVPRVTSHRPPSPTQPSCSQVLIRETHLCQVLQPSHKIEPFLEQHV